MAPLDRSLISPTLIGRKDEIAILARGLDAASAGSGQAILIAGDAGIGKSRLLSEIATRANAQKFLTVRGHCFEQEIALPYSPWIDALRRYFATRTPTTWRTAFGPFATDVVKLLPEFADPQPEGASPNLLDPETERRRIFDALAYFFTNLARQQPLLLLIEDVHWSDKTSLDFLHFFTRRLSALPILLLVTYRLQDATPALQHVLAQLDRERLCHEVALSPLARPEVEQMVGAILQPQRALHAPLVDSVYIYTEGNPFYIEEILKLWYAVGDPEMDVRREWSPRQLPIPRSVLDAVQQRTTQLSPAAKELLAIAAVMGRRIDIALLSDLLNLSEQSLLPLIKELLASQLVIEESDDHLLFRHALTREAIYAALLRLERKQYHQQIAAMMARLYTATMDRHLGALAYHAYEAGLWQQALDYSERAGRQAQTLFAAREAIVHFTRAIEAARQMDQPPPIPILRERGRAYEIAGEFDLARADFEQTLMLAQQHGDGELEWQAFSDLGLLWASHDYARTGDYFQHGLTLARTLDQPSLLAHSLNRVGNWFANVQQPTVAITYHEEALVLYAARGELRGLAETHDLMGMAHQLNCDLVASHNSFQQAIVDWTALQDRPGLVSSLASLALCTENYIKNLDYPALSLQAAIEAGEEARRMAQAITWRSGEAFATLLLAMTLGAQGEYARALEAAHTALRNALEIEHRQWTVGAHVALGTIYFDLLDYVTARTHLEEALALANATGSKVWIGIAVTYLSLVYVATNLFDHATALLDETSHPHIMPQKQGQRLAWSAKAELALATRAFQVAETITLELIESAANLDGTRVIPRLWFLHGRSLAAQGKHESAVSILLAAAQHASEQGARAILWRIQVALAKTLVALGRKADADAMFTAARRTIHDLAATLPAAEPLHQRFLAQALSSLPAPAVPTPIQLAKQNAGGLTRREREIALLIAQGKSNQEIATQLFVGLRTIEAHITRILTKLDFTSRVQIAAWVIERKLSH